jgi:hypothetical protein
MSFIGRLRLLGCLAGLRDDACQNGGRQTACRRRSAARSSKASPPKRCWKYDWVLEFDIKGLFDNIDHGLLLRAVRKQGSGGGRSAYGVGAIEYHFKTAAALANG